MREIERTRCLNVPCRLCRDSVITDLCPLRACSAWTVAPPFGTRTMLLFQSARKLITVRVFMDILSSLMANCSCYSAVCSQVCARCKRSMLCGNAPVDDINQVAIKTNATGFLL